MNRLAALRTLELDADASDVEVREAYRDLARVWHPDRFAGDARLVEKATRRMAEINEAYAFLTREAVAEEHEPEPSAPATASIPPRFKPQTGTIDGRCATCGHRNTRFLPYCTLCQTPFGEPARILMVMPDGVMSVPDLINEQRDNARAFLHARGVVANLTAASLAAVDAWLDEEHGTIGWAFDDQWTPPAAQQKVILQLGCYYGEVLRREFHGHWTFTNSIEELTIEMPAELSSRPILHVLNRFRFGSADALHPKLVLLRDLMHAKRWGTDLQRLTAAKEEAADWGTQAARYVADGRMDLARRFYERAVSVDGTFAPGLAFLGNRAFESQQFEEAASWYERALRTNPNLPTVSARLDETYAALGRVTRR